MEEKILDMDRDWETLKSYFPDEIPEDARDGLLTWLIVSAITN